MRNKQRGFTLVEIAIVLVIIGLLLGGILKGQELITSARVRNIADQNSGVQAAYYGFIDRYRQIPGDMNGTLACQAIGNSLPGCPSNGVGGNGNGRLEQDDYKEASALWAQLAAAGFIQGAYQGGATDDASYVAQTVAPINAFNGRLMLTRTAQYVPSTSTERLGLIIGNKIPVNVMRELDVKVDDGMPTTGVLRSTSATSANPSTVFETGDTCVTTAGNPIWNIDGNAQDCNAIYLY
jgi:prepilin-type N-terminal cleavage/methylation domain-containing protein